ncbi:hypothetical protein RAD16_09270 [Bradyrhizobium sp. 18BD]
MRLGINLRGDLAKLDDTEIAARHEELITRKEAELRALPSRSRTKLGLRLDSLLLARGPFHARIFYRLQWFLFALFNAVKLQDLTLPSSYNSYLLECELKDVRDEIKRRIAARKAVAAA